jgi:hypothetical protein
MGQVGAEAGGSGAGLEESWLGAAFIDGRSFGLFAIFAKQPLKSSKQKA